MEGEAKCTIEEIVNRINNKNSQPTDKKMPKPTPIQILFFPKFFNLLTTTERLSENTTALWNESPAWKWKPCNQQQ